jgi:hypothetical protein
MRTLFFLLLLANLTLLGYIRLDAMGNGEAVRLQQQVAPEKIRLLTPQQVAALGPDKTNALADVCAEWGPFGEADRTRALADLEPLALGRLLTQKRTETSGGWWVYLAPYPSRAAAERRMSELKAQGVQDVSVVDQGQQRFAHSLGVFRTEEAASAHLTEVTNLGVSTAQKALRQGTVPVTTLVIRDPPAAAVARLKELQAAYAGAELRIGGCEKSP